MILLWGGYTASRLTLETADLVDVALAKRMDPKQAQRDALAKEASYLDETEYYTSSVSDDLAAYEVADPGFERLRQPNKFHEVVSTGAPRTIAPGTSLLEHGLKITIRVEEIKVQRRGISTRSQHTVAVIENVGDEALAYFLQLRSMSGECRMQAMQRYNTMALSPGQKGEISVCSGSHAVEVLALRLMEVTELGAIWISKVSPLAVGHDDLAARSHDPGTGLQMCAEIPAVDFARRIEAGEMRWEDLVDFYSRHNCEHFRWWPGYTRIVEPLAQLPAVKPG